MSLYEYVGSSPTNFTDPLGLCYGLPGCGVDIGGGIFLTSIDSGSGGGSGGSSGGCDNNGDADCGAGSAGDAANGNDNDNSNPDKPRSPAKQLKDTVENNPGIQEKIEQAWRQSTGQEEYEGAGTKGREVGFWIGEYEGKVFDYGRKITKKPGDSINLGKPPKTAIGHIHTHPLPDDIKGPSPQDKQTAKDVGLPGIVVIEDPNNPGKPKLIFYDQNGNIISDENDDDDDDGC